MNGRWRQRRRRRRGLFSPPWRPPPNHRVRVRATGGARRQPLLPHSCRLYGQLNGEWKPLTMFEQRGNGRTETRHTAATCPRHCSQSEANDSVAAAIATTTAAVAREVVSISAAIWPTRKLGLENESATSSGMEAVQWFMCHVFGARGARLQHDARTIMRADA